MWYSEPGRIGLHANVTEYDPNSNHEIFRINVGINSYKPRRIYSTFYLWKSGNNKHNQLCQTTRACEYSTVFVNEGTHP